MNLIKKMMMTAAIGALTCMSASAEAVSFGEEIGQFSFENGISPAKAGRGSRLSVSTDHTRFGEKSLLWTWNRTSAEVVFDMDIPYLPKNPNPKETSVSSFVFWVYAPEKMDGQLLFTFYKGKKECCHFTYNMGFTGWRASWVAFDRDMTGKPEVGMDRLVVTAPSGQKKGRLYLDGIIPSSFQDVRYHTPDFQAPFINKETQSHWLILNNSWNKVLDIPAEKELTARDIEEMALIEHRFKQLVFGHHKSIGLEGVRKIYDSYGISSNTDGTIKGKPVFFTRFGETFINLGIKNASAQFKANGQLLRTFNDNLLKVAIAWNLEEDPAVKAEIAEMYVNLTRHILDQGFAAGSGVGTVHHLGYSMRNFYTSPILMKDVLVKAGLSGEVQKAMEWFSGVGEVKTAPKEPGIDIDAFNTSLMGRLASILMLEDTPSKFAYLQAIKRWIDNGFRYTSGTKACFKTDGTVFHHRKAYPAYATGGFTGAVNSVWMFHGTGFAISETSHEILKKALLAMRFYCNVESFPLAMSGRHPDGLGSLIPEHYAIMAFSGTPDGKKETDPEMASAYLRICDSKGSLAEKFLEMGFKAEEAPQGTRVFGYNCSMSHRNDQWLVTFAGHSRYLWATEIYQKCNHYGRYIAHGTMQIIGKPDGHPDSFGSGFRQEGLDWCHIPGATAAEIPMEEMNADVRNVDRFSGYEEMLLSDEWFAGGVSHKGCYGAYAMKLHEHDKYNGSLRANKSYFAFGNRIVALGSDIENRLEGAGVHTTLFQNSIDKFYRNAPEGQCASQECATWIDGKPETAMGWTENLSGSHVLCDHLGNAYIVRDADITVSRQLQHSFHEETDVPTEGYFEKAFIRHGTLCGKEVKDCTDHYEYLVLVDTDKDEVSGYAEKLPYEVIRCDKTVHAVRDLVSGTVGCAVFERSGVDGILLDATPSMLMYSREGKQLVLSVSNPDLALYEGPSDEWFDENGKRIERSIYSREWVDNPCGETHITVKLAGKWQVAQTGSEVKVRYEGGDTILDFVTAEARTEEVTLTEVR